jgi:hypothetical protein
MKQVSRIDKIIVKRIADRVGGRPLSIEEFLPMYLGELMFYYHDTFGLTTNTILDCFNKVMNGHI